MAKKKIEAQLKFEVGERVVICGETFGTFGTSKYPDTDKFTFTTIKQVNEDGSVVVEEGYKFRQSYETNFGDTMYHHYFRINRVKDIITYFNDKKYKYRDGIVEDKASFCGITYLFKDDGTFEQKAITSIQANENHKKLKALAEQRRLNRQKYFDKYEEVVKPLQDELNEKICKLYKEHICSHCKHSDCEDDLCNYWNLKLGETHCCSAFEPH